MTKVRFPFQQSFLLFVLFVPLFFLGSTPVDTSAADSAPSANGLWRQIGYGRIIEIDGDKLKLYDISKVSCFYSLDARLIELGKVKKVTKKWLKVISGINTMKFRRLAGLPALCKANEKRRKDPLYNFDSLWHTFDEHYSYFKTRNIDWNAFRTKYRSRLTSSSSEVELHAVISEMLESIGDGHINFETPEIVKAAKSKNAVTKEVKKDTKKPLSRYQLRQRIRKAITDRYLKETKTYNSGVVRWGMMKNGAGYIQINWMMFLANYKIPGNPDFRKFFGEYQKRAEKSKNPDQDERDGARIAIEKALSDLKTAKSLILDIRFNGGGKDEVSLEFLSHFTGKKRKLFTKKARLGNGYTKKQKAYVNPATKRFKGDVYLLTSPETASAAEIMTISSIAFPNIKRIGSRTEGVFSDILSKKLPNGWEYSLSNEIYQDLKGVDYENKGVPPHHKISYSRNTRDFYEQIYAQLDDGDDAIELALKIIAQRTR